MIPISTTTIDVLRPDTSADDYENDSGTTVVHSGVRAQISSPRGRGREIDGEIEVIDKKLECDPVDIKHFDIVRDNVMGRLYSVVWIDQRNGLGLDHTTAGLKFTDGTA